MLVQSRSKEKTGSKHFAEDAVNFEQILILR